LLRFHERLTGNYCQLFLCASLNACW
jgi:hypothetical protein